MVEEIKQQEFILANSSLFQNREAAIQKNQHRQVLDNIKGIDLDYIQLQRVKETMNLLRNLLRNCNQQPINKYLRIPLKQLSTALKHGHLLQKSLKEQKHSYRQKYQFAALVPSQIQKICLKDLHDQDIESSKEMDILEDIMITKDMISNNQQNQVQNTIQEQQLNTLNNDQIQLKHISDQK